MKGWMCRGGNCSGAHLVLYDPNPQAGRAQDSTNTEGPEVYLIDIMQRRCKRNPSSLTFTVVVRLQGSGCR